MFQGSNYIMQLLCMRIKLYKNNIIAVSLECLNVFFL